MKTYSPKPEHIERRWYVIDASDQVLGRIASEVAALLRGKHKPIFAPHMDTGDHVIVVNADKVVVTGGKEMKKFAYRHSGYPGGISGVRYDVLLRPVRCSPSRRRSGACCPKNRLGRAMIKQAPCGGRARASARSPEAGCLHARAAARVGGAAPTEAQAAEDASSRRRDEPPRSRRPDRTRASPPRGRPRPRRRRRRDTARSDREEVAPRRRRPRRRRPRRRRPRRRPTAEAGAETTESTEE